MEKHSTSIDILILHVGNPTNFGTITKSLRRVCQSRDTESELLNKIVNSDALDFLLNLNCLTSLAILDYNNAGIFRADEQNRPVK